MSFSLFLGTLTWPKNKRLKGRMYMKILGTCSKKKLKNSFFFNNFKKDILLKYIKICSSTVISLKTQPYLFYLCQSADILP